MVIFSWLILVFRNGFHKAVIHLLFVELLSIWVSYLKYFKNNVHNNILFYFIAPEVLESEPYYSHAVDWWSAGVLLFQMLTNQVKLFWKLKIFLIKYIIVFNLFNLMVFFLWFLINNIFIKTFSILLPMLLIGINIIFIWMGELVF